ncbi:hypothetical protein HanXRQr2_Chr04g0185451 [Helianthus annuus]|uniref:Uncharacterized protein n=1 Tax=Helianthus annuus TaxID=4232 RepID=A0A9K3JBC5_HELAN|nr:hypothetical protein HanXRQr2_Chr04g0185451 [Helianthus annuus]KAJ0932902.1 hypothetical protein HanPSC8_Chr04g0179001 [Helianthus annuus]
MPLLTVDHVRQGNPAAITVRLRLLQVVSNTQTTHPAAICNNFRRIRSITGGDTDVLSCCGGDYDRLRRRLQLF